MEEEFEDTWAIWMAEEGLELEDQIHHELLANRHLMDINDGTHGTWVDGTLGVLMAVSYTHLTLPTIYSV